MTPKADAPKQPDPSPEKARVVRRPARFAAAGLTDVGRQRRHNEDHVLLKPELGLYVVADGMGGHNAGNVASALTTTSLANFFEATREAPIPSDLADDDLSMPSEVRRLVAGVRKANRDVYEISSTYAQHQGMGSTIVAAHVTERGVLHVAHVGDSRCYRVRDGAIEQLTRDHSLVNEALELKPNLTPQEIAKLPKNIITRALGMASTVNVDVRTESVRRGDVYLLCSDGLSGLVPDAEILGILEITDDLREACELLVAMANDAGGTDNISAVLLRVLEEPILEDAESAETEAPTVERAPPPSVPRPGPSSTRNGGPPRPSPPRLGDAPRGVAPPALRADTPAPEIEVRPLSADELETGERRPSEERPSAPRPRPPAGALGAPRSTPPPPPSSRRPLSPPPGDAASAAASPGDPSGAASAFTKSAPQTHPAPPPRASASDAILTAPRPGKSGTGRSAPPPPPSQSSPAPARFSSSAPPIRVPAPTRPPPPPPPTLARAAAPGPPPRRRSWSNIPVARCKRCQHELLIGMLFCVECGARIAE